jgi:hypothetical protein
MRCQSVAKDLLYEEMVETEMKESQSTNSTNSPARMQTQAKPPLLSKKSQIAMRILNRAQKYLQDQSIIEEIEEVLGKGSYNLIKNLGNKPPYDDNETQEIGKEEEGPQDRDTTSTKKDEEVTKERAEQTSCLNPQSTMKVGNPGRA